MRNMKMIKKIKAKFKTILFRIIRFLVLRYFSLSVTSIKGKGEYKGIVAHEWKFENIDYEKYRQLKR